MREGNPALLVIDMQEDYVGAKNRYGYDSSGLISAVNARIQAAQHAGDLVLYVKNVVPRKGQPYCSALAEGLEVVSDIIIEKSKASVFPNTLLAKILAEHEIRQITIVGVDGNCCVKSTAIDAAKCGYSVVYPLQYIGIKNRKAFHNTKEKLLKESILVTE